MNEFYRTRFQDALALPWRQAQQGLPVAAAPPWKEKPAQKSVQVQSCVRRHWQEKAAQTEQTSKVDVASRTLLSLLPTSGSDASSCASRKRPRRHPSKSGSDATSCASRKAPASAFIVQQHASTVPTWGKSGVGVNTPQKDAVFGRGSVERRLEEVLCRAIETVPVESDSDLGQGQSLAFSSSVESSPRVPWDKLPCIPPFPMFGNSLPAPAATAVVREFAEPVPVECSIYWWQFPRHRPPLSRPIGKQSICELQQLAATRIQALARGLIARMRVANLRVETMEAQLASHQEQLEELKDFARQAEEHLKDAQMDHAYQDMFEARDEAIECLMQETLAFEQYMASLRVLGVQRRREAERACSWRQMVVVAFQQGMAQCTPALFGSLRYRAAGLQGACRMHVVCSPPVSDI